MALEPELFELFRGVFGALMRGGLINDQEFQRAHAVLDEHDPMAEQRAAEAAQAKQAQDWAEYQRLAEQFGQQAQAPEPAQVPQLAPPAPPAASGQFPQAFRQPPPAPPQGPPPVPSAGGGFHQEGQPGG